MSNEEEKSSDQKESYRPGYFQTKRALERLRLFQDLVQHHQRWGAEIQFARPIEELILNEKDPAKIHFKIEHKIAELIPLVDGHLHDADVPTTTMQMVPRIKPGSSALDHELIQVEEEQDLVGHYLYIKHDQQTFKFLMTMLQQGVGLYESAQKKALRDAFNPLVWIAWILRAPVFVFEQAGLSAKSAFVKFYLQLMGFLILAIMIFTATKLGISFPWDKILALFK